MPSARRVISPRSQSATACGASSVGRLSTQKNPRSSSECSACDLPAPESPVTTTTVGRFEGADAGPEEGPEEDGGGDEVGLTPRPPCAGGPPGSRPSSRCRSSSGP